MADTWQPSEERANDLTNQYTCIARVHKQQPTT